MKKWSLGRASDEINRLIPSKEKTGIQSRDLKQDSESEHLKMDEATVKNPTLVERITAKIRSYTSHRLFVSAEERGRRSLKVGSSHLQVRQSRGTIHALLTPLSKTTSTCLKQVHRIPKNI
ncbi:uncharacterized protein PgNI_01914 [Pyricularia grisea]|uniref:Uncharacterized protein n=1 Tax=Pyricularia grisea TaxID=148305 RepID=A0A6P8BKS3_PYRGI|nr:uncharacterized protein PgNI_01914 [Pyricularia grisea]TLD17265.1 hypothetical protein PgNI_01914 [Pyricularia grisea]